MALPNQHWRNSNRTQNKKKVYLRRAKRQARREFAPQRALLRRQMNQLQRQENRELRSVGGAVNMFSDVVSQAQEGLADSGLKGRYRKQVASELAYRAADAAQSAPTLRSQIRQEYRPEYASLRDAIASNRLDQSQTAQSNYKTMLSDYMKRQQSRMEEARKEGEGSGPKNDAVQIALAYAERNHSRNMRLLNTPKKQLNEDQLAERQMIQQAMQDPDYYWGEIAALSQGEGVDDPRQAQRAVAILQRRLDQAALGGVAQGVQTAAQAAVPPSLFELFRRTQRR